MFTVKMGRYAQFKALRGTFTSSKRARSNVEMQSIYTFSLCQAKQFTVKMGRVRQLTANIGLSLQGVYIDVHDQKDVPIL